MHRSHLGEFEQLVLLAILRLGEEAYAPAVSELLERDASREVSRGALYSSLARLETKGFLTYEVEPGDDSRAGYRKRRFTVTAHGVSALRAARDAWDRLSMGLEEILGGGRS